ncbi:hypothetical protein BKA64DRAFT_723344 [Cadophora sp. MPI-SDFR-AT-0126]|nr:hypothetical protein BKA64DRAFT_723344 [Leotiomycetes sp. MPI-SDFR-AT-0126]
MYTKAALISALVGLAAAAPVPSATFETTDNTTTVFSYNPTTQTLSLDAAVPGGQRTFVRADASLGFTQAHSASLPGDAYTSPFDNTPQTSEGSTGTLTFEGKSFSACPDGTSSPSGQTVYQLFADAVRPEDRGEDCIGVRFATAIWRGPIAYEYV